jgi:phenylalanyl-tRNA synthetase beta chain
MKFSENWLRTFVDPPMSSSELALALTMAGLEVESVEAAAPFFSKVVVGEVISVKPHPSADRLKLCSVTVGETQPLQIVCGAPNVAVGIKAPCALIGAELPGLTIRQSRVRGVDSSGMLCSGKELGLNEDDAGILVLDASAAVGEDVRKTLDLDDKVFALKLTPNRGDCLSVYGVAREIAAISASNLRGPQLHEPPVASKKSVPVRVIEEGACPLYCGRVVENVNVRAPTPSWLSRRLARSGIRGHNSVVDITNYVMLEVGQPLHAFDCDALEGAINVRLARSGEELKLINGDEARLGGDVLVIAGEMKALAIAGIMGGAASAVTDATRSLFLESAFFSPTAIAGKARKLGLSTDSSHRFERGVDYALTREALETATSLIREICGGSAGPVTEVRGELPLREPISLRASRLRRLLGVELKEAEMASILRRLHCSFTAQKDRLDVLPPSFRFDLEIEEDLVEELARLYGYEKIPTQLATAPHGILQQPEEVRSVSAIKRTLAARDYQEIVSYSFVSSELDAAFAEGTEAIALANPISREMAVMRTHLAGGLLECLQANVKRKQPRVRIFETGRCFLPSDRFSRQPERLAGLAYGSVHPEQWGEPPRSVDFYDVKGDIEAIFHPASLTFEPAAYAALHPGKSARILCGQSDVGFVGQLHPKLQQQFTLPEPPIVFELDSASLRHKTLPSFCEISKFPFVRRDLAVIVADDVAAAEILDAMRSAQSTQVHEIALFDLYRGGQIAPGKKSLAFRVQLQDTQKTLNDEEVGVIIEELKQHLRSRFNVEFRE